MKIFSSKMSWRERLNPVLPSENQKWNSIETTILVFSAICTICIVGWVLWCVRFGIDFADEGFYLNWISNPFKYSASVTQFGYIYHPIFRLVNGDIALLRQFNTLVTFLLGWVLSVLYLRVVFGQSGIKLVSQMVISAAIATVSLVFLRLWLPTPSYNWLAFQALMISMIGLLLARANFTLGSVFGWLLIGVGGWFAFMAKPSTAAALALISLFYIIGSGKINLYLIGLSSAMAAGLTLVFALLVDNSVFIFYSRLTEGLRYAQLLSPDYDAKTIFRVGSFYFGENEWHYFIYGIVVIAALHYISRLRTSIPLFILVALLFGITSLILSVVFGITLTVFQDSQWVNLVILAVPVFFVFIGFLGGRLGVKDANHTRSQWSNFLVLLALPYAFAFGTGNNYWSLAGLVAIFWILAGLSFLGKECVVGRALPLLSFAVAVQFYSVSIVLLGVRGPYYQPNPIPQSDYRIDIGGHGTTLMIPATFGRYISDASKAAREAGFVHGTPMIDLTGHSPGVLYALGASSPGWPWIYGNFANSKKSENFAIEVMKRLECEESASAWLLLEPSGPVKISPEILETIGADASSDFETVGDFLTAPYVGGFAEVQIQQLLKPKRPYAEAFAACNAAKEVSNGS
ncbi:hypothetical protein ACLIKD_12165 [Azonexus sp. IMCC34842]|uniref:hypothetical protein n=1 Tax=Azonexus sp. IMCC34842 TaxID=3420950 RepID=UPI003D09D32C